APAPAVRVRYCREHSQLAVASSDWSLILIRNQASRSRARMAGLALVLAAMAVLSVGCIHFDVAINVHDDGSGTVAMLTAVDTSVAEMINKSFGDAAASSDPAGDLTKIDKS